MDLQALNGERADIHKIQVKLSISNIHNATDETDLRPKSPLGNKTTW